MSVGLGVRLRPEEAVPLAHALVARAADDVGVRALAIKGPAVALQGLREPRGSADVDVLVHASDLETLVGRLVAVGWRRQVARTNPRFMPSHSVDVLNDYWPIGIDLHHYFPGFLADASQVFDALWARRQTVTLAGVPVPTCDPVGQVAVVALNLLRDAPDGESPALQDLRDHAQTVLTAEDVRALVRLAQETDATETLRPFLRTLGVMEDELVPVRDPEALGAWSRRVHQVGYEAWFVHFAHTPVRHWPREVWHALMLTDEEIYLNNHLPPGGGNLATLRLRRIRRGVAGVPRTVKAMVRDRRGRLGR